MGRDEGPDAAHGSVDSGASDEIVENSANFTDETREYRQISSASVGTSDVANPARRSANSSGEASEISPLRSSEIQTAEGRDGHSTVPVAPTSPLSVIWVTGSQDAKRSAQERRISKGESWFGRKENDGSKGWRGIKKKARMKLFENDPDAANLASSDASPQRLGHDADTMQEPAEDRMGIGMGNSSDGSAPKSRLGRAKRALQETKPEPKVTGPSWAGFEPVEPEGILLPADTPPQLAAFEALAIESLPSASIGFEPAHQSTSPAPPSGFEPVLSPGFVPQFDPPKLDQPSTSVRSEVATTAEPFTPSFAGGHTTSPAPDFLLEEPPSAPHSSAYSPLSLDVTPLDSTPPGSPTDSSAPDISVLMPPAKDVSLEELRAILTGSPDRFENIEHATWDPIAAAAKVATPSFELPPDRFRISAEQPVAVPAVEVPSSADERDHLDATQAPEYSSQAPEYSTEADRSFEEVDARSVTAMPIPDLSAFEQTTTDRVKKESKTPKTPKKARLSTVFAKQDVPDVPITENLSERSTKVLRIAAGALLALGLLLVAFLQFRDDSPKPAIPAITVDNTVASVTTAPGEPLDVPIAGATEVDDDFFSEGEDFTFSEGEDFTVK